MQALEAEKQVLPPLYRAVVEAGARSGQLPVALEGLARLCARIFRGPDHDRAGALVPSGGSEPRLRPLCGSGDGDRAAVSRRVRIARPFSRRQPLRWLSVAGKSTDYWWLAGPIVLLLLAIAWVRSGAAARFQSPSWTLAQVFPVDAIDPGQLRGGQLLRAARAVARAPGDLSRGPQAGRRVDRQPAAVARRAHALPKRSAAVKPQSEALETIDRRAFLPMLRWVLATGQEQGSLSRALRNLAGHYRRRGKYLAEKLSVFLADDHHGGDRRERNLVLRPCTFHPDHQAAESTFH